MDRGMKPVLLSLALALLMVGCGDGNVDSEDLEYRNGVTYLADEETPFTGRAESFYENGQKEMEWNYKDGMKEGLRTEWYENGQKKAEATFKDGKREGLRTKWHESGQKKKKGNYKDGKEDGLYTNWYESGQKRYEGKYKDGKLTSIVVWKPNGEKCPVTNVKDGNGVVVYYNEDGTEWYRRTYKDGKYVYD